MYAVTSIRRDAQTPLSSCCRAVPRPLSELVCVYHTPDPPSKQDTWSLRDEDVIVRLDTPESRDPRLVVFDMDSTLIDEECIDLLAAHAGVEAEVSEITRRAMNGELDFTASLAARVALLRGLEESAIQRVREGITFARGAREVCRAFKRLGCVLVLISGGFMPLATYVQAELGIDRVYANELEVVDGTLTGRTVGVTVNAERKRDLLVQLTREVGCRMEQVVAVGDGANDLLMLNQAGLGVAIHAKEKVQREAPARIRHGDLDTILYLFGFTQERVEELCRP